jgi:hypothetical protein
MTLGIALLVIFILYLIDKNRVWRQAVKVVIGLTILGVLVIIGLFSWTKYDEWQKRCGARPLEQHALACSHASILVLPDWYEELKRREA